MKEHDFLFWLPEIRWCGGRISEAGAHATAEFSAAILILATARSLTLGLAVLSRSVRLGGLFFLGLRLERVRGKK